MATIYVTAPPDAADDIAVALVEENLAACVNSVPAESTYRWNGELHEAEEERVLFVKTTDDAYPRALSRIEELHPQDVPCVERFDEVDILPPYRDWRDEVVDPD